MSLVKFESLVTLAEDLKETVRTVDQLITEGLCNPTRLPTYLLFFIAAKIAEFGKTANFGANYWRITPVQLVANVPILLVDTEPEGLVRKVLIALDSATGGPYPTIRIGDSASSPNSGGIKLTPGVFNELGEVPAKTRIFGVSDKTIQSYVVERA